VRTRLTRWCQVGSGQINKLSALHLATRLLTNKELAGFPHALLAAPYGLFWQSHSHKEWWFKEKLPTLSTQDMADYVTALSTLAAMVVFQSLERFLNKN
jgi:hypothetical protein